MTWSLGRTTRERRMSTQPERRNCASLLRRWLRDVEFGALEIEPVRSIASLKIDDTALTESGDRAPQRHPHTLEQTLFWAHDIVDELPVLRLRGRRGKNPNIAIE